MTESQTDQNDDNTSSESSSREIRYPENRVVGVVETPEQLGSAVETLTSGGFMTSEIEVLCGAAAAKQLRESTGRSGLAHLAMRISESIGMPNDESTIKNRYADALRSGKLLLAILALSEDRRQTASRILLEHGATNVKFFGKHTITGPARAD
jgi:hypothetical protein